MSHYTFPRVHQNRPGVEPEIYVSNSAMIRMSGSSEEASRGLQPHDYIRTPQDLERAVLDVTTYLGQVNALRKNCKMSKDIETIYDQFLGDLLELHTLIQSVEDVHRNAANGIRATIHNNGSWEGQTPRQILQKSRGQFAQMTAQLVTISGNILAHAELLRDTARGPRGPYKVITSALVNFKIGAIAGIVAPYLGIATNSWQINKSLTVEDTDAYFDNANKVILTSLGLTAVCFSALKGLEILRPDAEAYKSSNWNSTKTAMEKLFVRIAKLMDAFASMYLYWRAMLRQTTGGHNGDENLEDMVALLDSHVVVCRRLTTAIQTSSGIVIDQESTPMTMIDLERHPPSVELTYPAVHFTLTHPNSNSYPPR